MSPLPVNADYLISQLKALLEIPSPTGFTDAITHHVTAELARFGLAVELTRRGGVRAIWKGASSDSTRAIIVHLDTLGAQVKSLKDNGRIELVPVGTWSARFAEGGRVTLFTEAGTYRGTVLPLKASGHTFNEEVDELPVGWPHVELRIDALSRNRDDLNSLGIDIGDFVAFDPLSEFLDNGFIVSRFLDNKAGVAVALAVIEAMHREKLETPSDIAFLFSVDEEVGVGASSLLTPDIASMVTIDNGTTAPGQNSDEFGVTLAMADETGPFDYHLTRELARLCERHDIPFQKDVFRYYRSDSASAIEAGHDVRTALITFGVDASHGYERIHTHALVSLARLVTAYVAGQTETDKPTQGADTPADAAANPPPGYDT